MKSGRSATASSCGPGCSSSNLEHGVDSITRNEFEMSEHGSLFGEKGMLDNTRQVSPWSLTVFNLDTLHRLEVRPSCPDGQETLESLRVFSIHRAYPIKESGWNVKLVSMRAGIASLKLLATIQMQQIMMHEEHPRSPQSSAGYGYLPDRPLQVLEKAHFTGLMHTRYPVHFPVRRRSCRFARQTGVI